jgi:hypothetical protein
VSGEDSGFGDEWGRNGDEWGREVKSLWIYDLNTIGATSMVNRATHQENGVRLAVYVGNGY